MKNYLLLIMLCLIVFSCKKENNVPSTVTDIEGNVYHTIVIGSQVWLLENLKATRFNDSTAIPRITDDFSWVHLDSPGYSWFNNDSVTYSETYGALYNWYAVSTGKLAPAGWHIPSDSEWTTLINFLGGENLAGGLLKETGTVHWTSPNGDATNKSGFTALPGGDRGVNGACVDVGNYGFWWSANADDASNAWYRYIGFDKGSAGRFSTNVTNGFSVRCIMD